ncbi:GWT1-domain-containing protein [Scheffersomyces amazonensis]|uniref:GWT1-domain-containing protein n=1 Tax=Scheffersomyces amazonensis TaxID=1078765 RepID=UPI00315D89C1
MATLKEQKELFVSDLTGGTIGEIYAVTTVALTSYLSLYLIKSSVTSQVSITFLNDYVLSCLTILASITIYSSNITYLHTLIITPGILAYIISSISQHQSSSTKSKQKHSNSNSNSNSNSTTTNNNDKQLDLLPKKAFITAYRAHMLIITNLAILAVDFNIFPRRFAKVETWGTSLMDLGVGSFVFSMGLVNSRSLMKQESYKFSWNSYLSIVKRSIIKSIPILFLGIARLVSVKSLEYQEHVSEYGIHWNFFITLGFLPILLGILDPILNLFPRAIVAFVIAGTYEVILQNTNLLHYILTSENRLNNIITMNKEGIFSFIGYFSIFVFGQSFGPSILTGYKTVGNLLYPSRTKPIKQHQKSWTTVDTTTALIIFSIFYQLASTYFINVFYTTAISRRLANFNYVLWVVAYNASLLLGYNVIERLFPRITSTSYLLESTNNNGLLLFLISNLLTGFINMTINTLETNTYISFGILILYSLVISYIAVELNKRHIYIKL